MDRWALASMDRARYIVIEPLLRPVLEGTSRMMDPVDVVNADVFEALSNQRSCVAMFGERNRGDEAQNHRIGPQERSCCPPRRSGSG